MENETTLLKEAMKAIVEIALEIANNKDVTHQELHDASLQIINITVNTVAHYQKDVEQSI